MLFAVTLATDVSIFALNLVTGLGLGLGIDYALLVVNRFREQLAAGRRRRERRGRARSRTAGRTLRLAPPTVGVTLPSLVFPQYFLRSSPTPGSP